MKCGRDIFGGVGRATSGAEEWIAVFCTADDSQRIERRGRVRATVVIGSGMSAGAGAQIRPETADRISVVVRCKEWWTAFTFEPRLGMQFELERVGLVTVKGVTRGEFDFTCRCARNMRANA